MLRVALLNIFLLVLPLALYAVYFYVTQRNQHAPVIDWKKMPLRVPLQVGFALIALGMLATAFLEGDDAGGTYVPARMQDGRIIPGKVQSE